ncbi:MAG: TauD/TfdA family dioxygenase [Gemmatimonadetes bacterium]|nr:TauD/TfdA family dioxygenase [Gemmatimonadota bacterium]
MSLSIEPLEHVGVQVLDFDLRQPISDAMAEELKALWYEHAILVFREQDIDAETQIELSRVFGPLAIHPLPSTRHPDHPELFINKAGDEDDYLTLAYFDGEPLVARLDWHVDLIYTGKPNHGAVLRAVQVPDNEGMTGFGDRALAYDRLDSETQALLSDLEVAYHFVQNQGQMRFCDNVKFEPGPNLPKSVEEAGVPDFPDAAYPAVGTHPVSGRQVLQIVPFFLNRVIAPEEAGLSEDEADDLLRRIVKHVRRPELHYFQEWSPGDVIMWDNWRAMHCTTGTRPGTKRLVHRTTILGDATLGRQLA